MELSWRILSFYLLGSLQVVFNHFQAFCHFSLSPFLDMQNLDLHMVWETFLNFNHQKQFAQRLTKPFKLKNGLVKLATSLKQMRTKTKKCAQITSYHLIEEPQILVRCATPIGKQKKLPQSVKCPNYPNNSNNKCLKPTKKLSHRINGRQTWQL